MALIKEKNYGIENEVTSPIKCLYRPKNLGVKFGIGFFCYVLLFGGYFMIIQKYGEQNYIPPVILGLAIMLIAFLDFIALGIICIYQRFASASTRARCMFKPSCSNYAKLALWKYGLFISLPMICLRFHKCGQHGGIDYP